MCLIYRLSPVCYCLVVCLSGQVCDRANIKFPVDHIQSAKTELSEEVSDSDSDNDSHRASVGVNVNA